MVYPTDIPDLSNETPPNLDNGGGLATTKVHSLLHKELADNLEAALNQLGLPGATSTSTTHGKINALASSPHVSMLRTTDLQLESGKNYLINCRLANGTAAIRRNSTVGAGFNFNSGQLADYSPHIAISGTALTPAATMPYPLLITQGTVNSEWWISVLNYPAAVSRFVDSFTWPFDTNINTIDFTHNLGTEEVLVLVRGTFDVNGTNATLTYPLPVQPVSTSVCRLRTYDYPDSARPVRGSSNTIIVKRL